MPKIKQVTFFVEPSKSLPPRDFPFVKLSRRSDNDNGIKSTFRAVVFLGADEAIDLGFIKIIKLKQTRGMTPLKPTFTQLGPDYCSLGQNFRYYETLFRNLPEYSDGILSALRDMATNEQIERTFHNTPAFRQSLVRQSPAIRALKDARNLRTTPKDIYRSSVAIGAFTFKTSIGAKPFEISFRFGSKDIIPRRINAVIGPNGSGKTRLLANLAFAASAKLDERHALEAKYGRFIKGEYDFGSVIAISYSAFDRFDVPGKTAQEKRLLSERGEIGGYVYCGLRRIESINTKRETLKTIDELVCHQHQSSSAKAQWIVTEKGHGYSR